MILDISKLHMYKFHYNHIVRKYGERARLLFTETDSLCYDIRTDDLHLDMKKDLDFFDTAEHPIQDKKNAKVIWKFKDECNSLPALEFVGLRSKMYSLLLPNDKKKPKVSKGVHGHLSRGSLVRGSLVRGSLVRRFSCPEVHLSVLFVGLGYTHSQGYAVLLKYIHERYCDVEIYMGETVLLEYCGEISPAFPPVGLFQFLLSCGLMWPDLYCVADL